MLKYFHISRVLCTLVAFFVVAVVAECADAQPTQSIVYVDGLDGDSVSPSPSNPGDSWNNAYLHLQDGLVRAGQLDPSVTNQIQIWVRGTSATPPNIIYRPDEDATNPDGLPEQELDRTISFELRNSVGVYGGFAGTESPGDFALRNPAVNITILNGDLLEDDNPEDPFATESTDDNAYHVVFSLADNATAILDGVRVTGGNGEVGTFNSLNGGGILCQSSSPTIYGCTIKFNNGAGISCQPGLGGSSSAAHIRKCIIEDNSNFGDGAGNGGGVVLEAGHAVMIDCTVQNNIAGNYGGGIWAYNSMPQLIACTLKGNSATVGGGLCVLDNAPQGMEITLINCLIVQNSVTDNQFNDPIGGGAYFYIDEAKIRNCTFADNTAEGIGGGVYSDANFSIYNSIFWDNAADGAPNQIHRNGLLEIAYTDVDEDLGDITGDGTTQDGGGNFDAFPNFVSASNYRLNCPSDCIDAGNPAPLFKGRGK